MMFHEVPLIDISTKEINVKIPALTSDDINKYEKYLEAWVDRNEKTIQQREEAIQEVTKNCSSPAMQEQRANTATIKKELADLQNSADQNKARIEELQQQIRQNEFCERFEKQKSSFISFSENSYELIRTVQANIKVLEQYKRFPGELYEWIHVSDRYLAEISSVASSFVGGLTSWLDINANRFSQYVDAITLIVWAIKTWQAIIDFSVDRSEKCSSCSNDNYGSFSCSLSFLCPQLPIFKIPPFKIPDITLDLSHIEVWLDIVLPKFNFVPIKTPLPELPNLPEPPNIQINIDTLMGIKIPEIPILPWPPQLPPLPSFIPNIDLQLPLLPPAPKIPKILPEINATLKVAEFIGKVFCIVKGGIGLVGEKWVKARIEQLTQRKRNVPIFDFFDLTSKYQDPPLQWFDYTIDAYVRLKYNFEGVYSILDGLAQASNQVISTHIEAPMQSISTFLSSGADALNEQLQKGENNINININRLTPMDAPGMEYADAYRQLQQELETFTSYAAQDKKILSQIEGIKWIIQADNNIQAANQDIWAAKEIADNIVETRQREIRQIAKEIQDYDLFIQDVQKQKIQLVNKHKDISTSIATPLFKTNEHTKQLLAQQESPQQTYLSLNKQLVEWYQQALSYGSPESLNMTPDTYNKSTAYLDTLTEKIHHAQGEAKPLLASSCVGSNCPSNSLEAQGYKQDISSYAQGIFVQTGTAINNTDVMVNVMNSQKVASAIGKNYLQVDLNNDKQTDLLLRDSNTIYAKYAWQKDTFLSAGGNNLTSYYNKFFAYQKGNKRWIESTSDLAKQTDNGYATFGNIQVKIRDSITEVKNFVTQGQSYDSLQLSRRNSIVWGEAVSGYIIKITYKIDNFLEKVKSFNFFGVETTPTQYLLILPQGSSYSTGLLSVENIKKRPIRSLLTGDVRAVKYFDPWQEMISISITEAPSRRLYAQIAPLKQDPSQLSKAQQKSLALFTPWWPRSNQIVVGKQILADTTGPDATIVFQRVLTNEVISTGNAHQGWINTNYSLQAYRTDTNAITHMTIEHNGQTIASKIWTTKTAIPSKL